jgi:alpha-2-macroglobulin
VPAFIARNGMVDAEDATIDIGAKLPSDVAPGSVKYNVYLSSSSIGPLMGTFSSLIDYPYGCTEQTMSRLMPSVVAIRMNQVLGAPLSQKDKDKFKEVYKQAMKKLDDHQHSDGGWGWWVDDDSNPYLTSLVLEGYDLLKQSGFYTDPDREKRAVKWLKQYNDKLLKELTDPLHRKDSWTDNEAVVDMARAARTLANHKQPVNAALEKFALAQKNLLGPQALCYFTTAFQKSGKSEVARVFYDRLIEVSNTVGSDMGTTLDWSETEAMAKKYGNYKEYWRYFDSYRCTDVERTALALETVTATEPENSDRIESIKRWILTQRGKDGWSNTKTTAQVYRAFMAAELLNKNRADTNFIADVQLPGQTANLTFGPKSVVETEKNMVVKNASAGTCTLHKKGAGKLYYTTLITFYRSMKPGGFVAAKAIPEQLKLRREFYRLKAGAPDADGNVHFTQELISDRKVKAGETILMKVYVDSPIYAPYILMEVPLPSGAEVAKEDSRTSGSSSDEEDGRYYNFGSWWWTHQDILDDRVAFFVNSFPADKREFHTMLRMELPGKFQLNPLTFEGMYTNRVRAYSQADTITVTE